MKKNILKGITCSVCYRKATKNDPPHSWNVVCPECFAGKRKATKGPIIKVFCSCGKAICTENVLKKGNVLKVTVELCPYCRAKEYKEGVKDGYAAGEDESWRK